MQREKDEKKTQKAANITKITLKGAWKCCNYLRINLGLQLFRYFACSKAISYNRLTSTRNKFFFKYRTIMVDNKCIIRNSRFLIFKIFFTDGGISKNAPPPCTVLKKTPYIKHIENKKVTCHLGPKISQEYAFPFQVEDS